MKKLLGRKRLLIPVMAIAMLVAMAGTAFALTLSSYSLTIPAGMLKREDDNHIYGSSSDTFMFDYNDSADGVHKGFLHCGTHSTVASNYTGYIYEGGHGTATLYTDHRSSGCLLRFMAADYSGSANFIEGDYGVD